MKNKLVDLNNHLFEMIERLNDENLTNEDLQKEIGRAAAMSNISKQIIDNAKVELGMLNHIGLTDDVELNKTIVYTTKLMRKLKE